MQNIIDRSARIIFPYKDVTLFHIVLTAAYTTPGVK